jgi:hypothetical protein
MPEDSHRFDEQAQAAFADLADGDYVLADLMQRSPDVAKAILHLCAVFARGAASPRIATFRGVKGLVQLARPGRPASPLRNVPADQITVSVRDGRVVRMVKT